MIWIDGYKWPPDLHGTGSEDYFNIQKGILFTLLYKSRSFKNRKRRNNNNRRDERKFI